MTDTDRVLDLVARQQAFIDAQQLEIVTLRAQLVEARMIRVDVAEIRRILEERLMGYQWGAA